MRSIYFQILLSLICINKSLFAQKLSAFPTKTDPLHVKVDMFNKLMLANNWNEGTFMHSVIYPPAGLERTAVGRYADSVDETTNMLIDRYHYDDHQINSKIIFPKEWRNPWDDCHAVKSLYMLMRFEKDRSLLNKYRMNLNRHWIDWKNRDFSFENDALFILTYQILTGENVMTAEKVKGIKQMWG